MLPDIKASLIALHAGIKSGDGEVLRREMAALDRWAEEGSGTMHPQLLHFLKNRSYAKALMWVEGASDIPAGVCGGRAGKERAS